MSSRRACSRREGRLALVLASVMIWVVSTVAPAHADSAVLRPLPEQPPPSAAAQLAQETAGQALSDADVHVIEAAEARQRLQQAAENPCLDVNCASSVLRVLDADMLVAVTVASDGEVLVALVDARGNHVNATAPSQDGDVGGATRAAINRALSKWPTRELVPIQVRGTPSGAMVTVDGQPRGTLPLEVRVQPGRHEIVVAMSGYQGKREYLQVSAGEASAPTVEVRLEPDASAAHDRRARWGLIGGPVLALAGAATMTVALASFAREGCEQRAPNGVCVEREQVAVAPTAVWTSVGALALAGGVTWFALSMRRTNKASTRPQLGVGFNQVMLRGSF